MLNFLTSVGALIKPLDKYSNSIALAITNVNKKYSIKDITILKDVADAFKSVENDVKSNLENVKLIETISTLKLFQ